MGVLECSNRNCDGIMSSHYFPDIGYVCSDCISAFKRDLDNKGIKVANEKQYLMLLSSFVGEYNPSINDEDVIDVYEFLNKYDRHRDY